MLSKRFKDNAHKFLAHRLTWIIVGLILAFGVFWAISRPSAQTTPPDWIWAESISGTGAENAKAVTKDDAGNLYIAGGFDSVIAIATPIPTVLTPAGLSDIFIAKYDEDGNPLWARAAGGTGNDLVNGIVFSSELGEGFIYITGNFEDTADFYEDAGQTISTQLTSVGDSDIFLAKFQTSDGLLANDWAKVVGSSLGPDEGLAVAVDDTYVYTTGSFNIGAGFDVTSCPGEGNQVIQPIANADKNRFFAIHIKDTNECLGAIIEDNPGDDAGLGITLDASSNIYISGYFTGSAIFNDPTFSIDPIELTSFGAGDAFVAKYSDFDTGVSLLWARAMGGDDGGFTDLASDLQIDTNGDVLVTGLFAGDASENPPLFIPAPSSPVSAGSSPQSVAVGDFDADSNLDLAVANFSSNNVSILLGNGDGTFGAATNFSVGFNPISVVVGDFNADPNLDLAVANYTGNNVSILLGNGDGTFVAATNFSTGAGSSPFFLAVGDFDTDSDLDLVTANNSSNNVSILLGNGLGSFGPATNFPAGTGPMSVAVGNFNFNVDSNLDIAVANFDSDTVSILLGNGDGSFTAAGTLSVEENPMSVAVGDFDADSNLDLAVLNNTSATVSILLGDGLGSFGTAANFPAGTGPRSITVGNFNFNADSNLDLAVANEGSNKVSVLLGDGFGSFSFSTATNFSVGLQPISVAVGDFDADSDLDLAVANSVSNNVSILLNNSDVLPNLGLVAASTLDIFATKIDPSDGSIVWARRAGNETEAAVLPKLTLDASDNVYVAGNFSDSADATLDNTTETLTSAGGFDIMAFGYDSNGDFLWAKRAGGSGAETGLQCSNATDDDGDIFINDGCPQVGPAETGPQCVNAIDDDADGIVNDGCPATANDDFAADIVFSDFPDDSWYVTGSYESVVASFNPDLSSSGGTDGFLAKLSEAAPIPNIPPVANAGPDQTVNEGAGVTLDGSASDDPDDSPNPILGFSWVQTAGLGVTLSDATSSNPTFTAPQVGSTLTFELTVDDGEDIDTDTVDIFVSDVSQGGGSGSIMPRVTLSATSDNISAGGSTILNWDINRTPCAASSGSSDSGVTGQWGSGNVFGSTGFGSQTINNLTTTTTFTLTCFNVSASATVTVSPAPPAPACGDNKLDLGEECDDGNNISGDGCRANCLFEIVPPEVSVMLLPPIPFTVFEVLLSPPEPFAVDGAIFLPPRVEVPFPVAELGGVSEELLSPRPLDVSEGIVAPRVEVLGGITPSDISGEPTSWANQIGNNLLDVLNDLGAVGEAFWLDIFRR